MADEKENPNKQKREDSGNKGPRTALALTLEKIEDKKVTVKATLYNSLTERVLRFIIENTTFSDGIKKTENKEAIYSFVLPDKMSEIRIRVEVIDWRQVCDQITVRLDLQRSGQTRPSDVKEQKMVEIFGPIGPEKKFSIIVSGQKNQDVKIFSRAVLTIKSLIPDKPETTASTFNFQVDDNGILNLLIAFAEEDTQINFLIGKETKKRMLIK